MKGRLFVGGVSAALLAGGMMLATGCASVEDAPMPPGAYVPPETEAPIAVKGTEEQPQVQGIQSVAPVTPVLIENPEPVTPPPASTEKPEPKTTPATTKPVAKPVAKPARKTETTHTIQKGDSFWSIALLYGVTMDEVIAANPGMDPLKLKIGDKVTVPAPGPRKAVKKSSAKAVSKPAKTARRSGKKTVAKPVKDDGLYVVRKGDSFSRIAARHHIKAADLAAANDMTLDQTLQIGQKLVIPKPGQKTAPVKRQAKPIDTASKKAGTAAQKTETEVPAPAVPGTTSAADAVPVPEVPAVPGEKTPAPAGTAAPSEAAAPAAPVASPAALSAVSEDTTPTAVPVTGGYTADIDEDTTLEALAKKYGFGVAELKKLNPEIPADGKVRAGSVIKLP